MTGDSTLLLCLYRHPAITPDQPRLGLARLDDIVDVNLACLTSLAGHMRPRRAQEIADALAPADLLSFLEGGRHAWNALSDSIVRLGRTLDVGITGPGGEQLVVPKTEVRLTPLVPAAAGWSSEAMGAWSTMPVPSPGSDTIVALHTDGHAYLPEYLAVMASTVTDATPSEAIESVALVAVVRPSRPESPCLLHRMPTLPVDEVDIIDTITAAVVGASAMRTLYVGDVVRCGPALVTGGRPVVAPRTVDLRDGSREPAIDLTVDIVPAR